MKKNHIGKIFPECLTGVELDEIIRDLKKAFSYV